MEATLVARRKQIAELCRLHGVSRLEVFGSAAVDGKFDPQNSDYDFIACFADRPAAEAFV